MSSQHAIDSTCINVPFIQVLCIIYKENYNIAAYIDLCTIYNRYWPGCSKLLAWLLKTIAPVGKNYWPGWSKLLAKLIKAIGLVVKNHWPSCSELLAQLFKTIGSVFQNYCHSCSKLFSHCSKLSLLSQLFKTYWLRCSKLLCA